MKSLLVGLALSAVGFAAIEGVVTNRTTGKPQAGVAVTVVELGQGMKSLGTTKTGGDGKFTLPGDFAPGSPHLIQANTKA
jgi:5-hydroxyisourate hydrolase-like protein (transthyretin family)